MNLNEFKKMNKPGKKLTIRVYENIYNELQQISKNEDLSLVKLTNYILDDYIKNYNKQKNQNK
jgi:predicted DNA-binding ribbon-helix-helix protein